MRGGPSGGGGHGGLGMAWAPAPVTGCGVLQCGPPAQLQHVTSRRSPKAERSCALAICQGWGVAWEAQGVGAPGSKAAAARATVGARRLRLHDCGLCALTGRWGRECSASRCAHAHPGEGPPGPSRLFVGVGRMVVWVGGFLYRSPLPGLDAGMLLAGRGPHDRHHDCD